MHKDVTQAMLDKRRHDRYSVVGLTIDISDGFRVYTQCDIVNISNIGILAKSIPVHFVKKQIKVLKSNVFKATINDVTNSFRINISPRWLREEPQRYLFIGFEINDHIDRWLEFINTKIVVNQRIPDDVWGIGGEKYIR